MAASGFQLTTFLYGLYFGRRKMPALPQYLATRTPQDWSLGLTEGPVEVAPNCSAVQTDPTTCGSVALALAKASDPNSSESAILGEAQSDSIHTVFNALQHDIKGRTNRRKGLFAWPKKYGTPPWGASREMHFSGHDYFDRMVVDTSLPQSSRVLTHAAQCALRGFPVLLYVGGDTSMGIGAGAPRHVVVLHSPPEAEISDEDADSQQTSDSSAVESATEAGVSSQTEALGEADLARDVEAELAAKLEEIERRLEAKIAQVKQAAATEEVFDPELLVYEPSSGRNYLVTLKQLIDQKVERRVFGGWPHITWAVMPKAQGQKSDQSQTNEQP